MAASDDMIRHWNFAVTHGRFHDAIADGEMPPVASNEMLGHMLQVPLYLLKRIASSTKYVL